MWSFRDVNDKSENPKILKIGSRHVFQENNFKYAPIVDKENGNTVGEILIVDKVTRDDAGIYICTITNVEPKIVQFKVNVVSKKTEATTHAATTGSVLCRFPELTTSLFILLTATAALFRQ